MKIRKITYPTPIEKIENPLCANIDVFVETDNGLHFTMTVCTPQFYLYYMEKEGIDFVTAGPPDIIVKSLQEDVIKSALTAYCEDDGYWMKLYFLAGADDGPFTSENLDEAMKRREKRDRGPLLLP